MGTIRDMKDFARIFSPENINKVMLMTSDIRVMMADEFDRNFDREAFFHRPWKPSGRVQQNGGKTLQDRTILRKSFKAYNDNKTVTFVSNRKDATLHNEGGSVKQTITPKMKRWAWAMHKETGAPIYKAMALTKKKSRTITMPQRQIIGNHPTIDEKVNLICQHTLKQLFMK